MLQSPCFSKVWNKQNQTKFTSEVRNFMQPISFLFCLWFYLLQFILKQKVQQFLFFFRTLFTKR